MMTRLSIDISNELHHYLKIHTARTKVNIKNFVTEAIYRQIDQEKIPNKKTVKALEQSKKGVGLKKFASVEDMFDDLYQDLEEEGFEVKKHV